MPLSFPSNPTLNQTSTQNGRVYQWSGYAWELAATSGSGGGSSGGGSSSLVYGATALSFPGTGSADNLYCAKDTNRLYRWDTDESAYIEVGPVGGGGTDLSPYFLPPAPTNLTATSGNTQVVLSWTAPTVLAQTPITDYVVQFKEASAALWTTFSDSTSTSTSATVTGLTNGTAYVFRVAAVNGVGTGAYTAASSSVTPSTSVSIDMLLVAGGGGGGGIFGGGGGAGGVVYSQALTVSPGTYTVVVGAGGTATGTSWGAENYPGADSIALSQTAFGGGLGGSYAAQSSNRNGGSGGGANGGDGSQNFGTGVAGQGNNGGLGGTSGGTGGGGGGGASAAGADGTSSAGGAGGAGIQNTITGSAVVYGGGGGGGELSSPGAGGAGGGGAGGANGVAGTSGTANLGGGGGGAKENATAGSGGSGVVILRCSAPAASTTGSPTVTTVGGDTVYTFTGSGSITF